MGQVKKLMSNRLIQLAFSTFLLGCIWTMLALGVGSVLIEDIRAPYKELSSYETTKGIVISSQVIYGGPKAGWQFEIYYQYQLYGKQYISNKVNFVNTGDDYDTYARNYVEKYPIGKVVTVYYERTNPSKSVLEPKNYSSSALFFTALPFILSLLCYGFAIRFFLKGRIEIRRLDEKVAQKSEAFKN